MHGYEKTVASQYLTRPVLMGLIGSFNAAVDPRQNIDRFYEFVWNLDTAQGYGLDVLGRIVGVSRVLQVSSIDYLGFKEANDSELTPFGQAPFYGGVPLTSNYALTDTAFRTLIEAKAAANITDCSIPSINNILMTLFGSSGECWCTDGGNMTMTYSFAFELDPVSFAIIEQSGVIPKPTGVSVTIVQNASA